MFKKITLFTVLLFPFITFAKSTPTELFSLINLRLSYMEDVALYKALNHKPIEDITREAIVIKKSSQSAEKAGLNKQSVMHFFQAQIAAAKAIQYRYRADLLNTPTTHTPRNLTTEIRPKLIILGEQINKEIARYLKEEGKFLQQDLSLFKATLNTRYLTEIDKDALFKSLTKITLN